jgi:dihydroneopterin aldolase
MAATSNHYGDVANWIEKVIESCETSLHEETAKKLVHLYEFQFRDIDRELNFSLSKKLRAALDNKFYSRMDKLVEKIKNPK